jgi:hypothetical protein
MNHSKFLALNADTPVSKEQEGCNIKHLTLPLGVIVANRLSDDIIDVKGKVYTRDIFNSDS